MANNITHERPYWHFLNLYNNFETENYVKGLNNQLSQIYL